MFNRKFSASKSPTFHIPTVSKHKIETMKPIIILAFIIAPLSLFTQDFFPIPVDTTSVWRIARQHNDGSCVYNYNSIYYINGTEIKNGKEYHKVYEEGRFHYSSVNPQYPCTGSHLYSGVYLGGIRTENGKTYGYKEWYSPSLLMDFTLQEGDTMYSSLTEEGKIIESIDSVLVGDHYRKRFNFIDYWDYCTWMVEGVGHQRGLFESMDYPFESESWFICYGENSIPIYGNGNCDITVGVFENETNITELEIFPNPTSENINVYLPNSTLEIISYLLSDVYGNHMKANFDAKASELKLNIKNYKAGIYFLVINLNNSTTINRKIVKK